MSKTLKFVDKSTLNVGDASTATNIIVPVKSFAEIDEIREKFTKKNTAKIEIDGVAYHNLVPVGCSAAADIDGIPTAVFTMHEKSEVEILRERVDEQEEIINSLMMG